MEKQLTYKCEQRLGYKNPFALKELEQYIFCNDLHVPV